MKYFLAHTATALLISAFWGSVLILGGSFIAGMFESHDLGIIACFVYGLLLGGPILGTYYYLHPIVDDAVWRSELNK